ncbi:MAG: aminotransferase class I/II-fold pyridoxal phosphate-dependent enzyme [Gemmatimonadetes bacterium]|jgi:aspartate/methionine/tyrosine aminotransferase|nr:aminotransferase class I/II-fold pyridoxal phosphate-dependent enzyme [Gemmatimonadota bacterium]
MKPFAEIPSRIPRSGIREVMDLAWEAEKTGEVIHLEVGQPDFPTPEHIVEATCQYVREGHTKYVPNSGVDRLRETAARYFAKKTGIATTADNILITPGAVMSVASAFLSLLEIGEEVLLPDPGWPNYSMAVPLVHGASVYYSLRPENNFLPDLEEMDRLVTPRTKLLLLCSPSNPTGQVYDADTMKGLMEFGRRHDLWVLSDEIYGEIVFDHDHVSALPFDTDGRSLIISGMSKTYAMTGYRVGFTRACPEYIELAGKLQEPLVSCGSGFSQLASADALEGPQDCVEEMRAAYHRRRDIALDVLRQHDLYQYTPGGAFYLLIDISSTGMDAREFTLRLIQEKRVAAAPGDTFGQVSARHIRISIASSDDNIREGVTRICEIIKENSAI